MALIKLIHNSMSFKKMLMPFTKAFYSMQLIWSKSALFLMVSNMFKSVVAKEFHISGFFDTHYFKD